MKLKTILFYTVCIVTLGIISSTSMFAQAVGDYRSAGTGNWGTLATWQRWSGAAWNTPTAGQGYPGQNTSTAAVTIQNGHTITLNVSPANSIASLTIAGGGTATSLTIGANTLTVNGAVTMNAGTGFGDNRTIAVTTGTFNAGSVGRCTP